MWTLASDEPLVLVMVGLPARGKTFLARKVARYLNWHDQPARVFNVGNYRRDRLGPTQPASFFDPANPEGAAARHTLAIAALDDLCAWIRAGPGRVAIYDATNVSRARRDEIARRLAVHGISPIFVETVCDEPSVIEGNIRETKLSMPDYAGIDPDAAAADFRARIAHYERAYEPVGDEEGSSVRIVDLGRQIVANRISGYLPSRLVFFLSNLHVGQRPIVLTRHGESEYNVSERVGGDPPLTARGRAFSVRLAEWLAGRWATAPRIWTSTLRRSIETAAPVPWAATPIKNLDEIDAGTLDGLTYAEIAKIAPEEAAARSADKYRYRYPRGESYRDVIARLDPVIVELERQRESVVIVAHQAVVRCLYAYLTDLPPERCPHLSIPLHTVLTLVPRAYGAAESRADLGADGSG